ncbi:DUF1963 domain-containing protein [Leptolyngbya sp. 15MV]|nr:DUF1963 domain-containing protein [Leptolyngbya sp. 15MV]
MQADADGRQLIRAFPRWQAATRALTQYDSSLRGGDQLSQARYSEMQRAAERAAIEAAFGPAPPGPRFGWDVPSQDGLSPPHHPCPRKPGSAVWMPGEDWPQTWLHALVFEEMLFDSIANSIRHGTSESEVAAASAAEALRHRNVRYARALEEGRGVLRKGQSKPLFGPLEPADHAAIRSWVERLPFDPGHNVTSALWRSGVEACLGRSFVQATNALLGYRPDLAGLIGGNGLDYVRATHAPHMGRPGYETPVRHHLLGKPLAVQGAPDEHGATHILLAQFDSDPGMFWCWADAGVLQFWIAPDHLAARRFERAFATLEGH